MIRATAFTTLFAALAFLVLESACHYSGRTNSSMRVTVFVDPTGPPKVQGDHVIADISVTNDGPDDVQGAFVEAILGAGVQLVAGQADQGECLLEELQCALGQISVGSTVLVTLVLEVLADATDPASFEARIHGYWVDPDTSDNTDSAPIAVDEATLQRVDVGPKFNDVPESWSQQFEAWAFYDKGPPRNVTEDAVWLTTDSGVALVSGGYVTTQPGSAGGFAGIDAQFGGAGGAILVDSVSATLEEISFTCETDRLGVGEDMDCLVKGRFSEGSVVVIPEVGTIPEANHHASLSCDGTIADCPNPDADSVKCLAVGDTTVTVTVGAESADWPLTCTLATAETIQLSPADLRTTVGTQTFFEVYETRDDGRNYRVPVGNVTVGDLSLGFPETIAAEPDTFGYTSLGGSDQITLEQGFTDTATARGVTSGSLEIETDPAAIRIGVGGTLDLGSYLVVTGATTAGNVTLQAEESSVDPGVAEVARVDVPANTGRPTGDALRVIGVSVGETTISVTLGGVSSPAIPVDVYAAPESIRAEPADQSSPVQVQTGTTKELRVIAEFDDPVEGLVEQDVTKVAFVTSSDPVNAPVQTSDPDAGIFIIGRGATSATISAHYNGLSATLPVGVTNPTLQAVFSSGSPSLRVGTRSPTFVGGSYDDFSFAELGDVASCDLTAVVGTRPIACGSGARDAFVLYGLSPGQADVVATFQGVSGGETVVVHDGDVTSINVSAPPSMLVGDTAQLNVFGNFDDGGVNHFQDLTLDVVCESDDPSALRVSNVPGKQGTLEALGESPGVGIICTFVDDDEIPHSAGIVIAVAQP